MEDAERKEVAPVNATKTQNSGVLSFGETREDIVREMREGAALFADKGDRLFANVLAGFAKRVEALGTEGAHGGAPAKQGQETVTDCHGLGNVARLREVVKWAVDTIDVSDDVLEETEDVESEVVSWVRELQDRAASALAAPPRNCDVCPVDPGEAAKVFHAQRGAVGYCYTTHKWLLDPATPENGGGHDAA